MASKHGGVRVPGKGKKLGRPPKKEKKGLVSIYISLEVIEYLKTGVKGVVTEAAIRDSKGFRDWKKTK